MQTIKQKEKINNSSSSIKVTKNWKTQEKILIVQEKYLSSQGASENMNGTVMEISQAEVRNGFWIETVDSACYRMKKNKIKFPYVGCKSNL